MAGRGASPGGRYSGTKSVLGNVVRVVVDVHPRGDPRHGVMDLSVSCSGGFVSFECPEEEWSLAKDDRQIELVTDACWERFVQSNVQDLQMSFDSEANEIVLTGSRQISIFQLPVSMTLHWIGSVPMV